MAGSGEVHDVARMFDEGTAVTEAVRRGWFRAVRRHRLLGVPLLVLEQGRIVELDPNEVEIPDEVEAEPLDPETYELL